MVAVDPQRLRAIAGRVSDAAKTAGAAYTNRSTALAPADGQGAGWSTAAVARSASTAWGAFVGQLSGSVSRFGGELTRAAADYEASDQNAAARANASRLRQEQGPR